MFRWAAIYGVIVLFPLYFVSLPPGARVETHFGFVGAALVFQGMFWIIGGAPEKYRALMPLAVIEKLVFSVPALTLYALGRLEPPIAIFAAIDLALGAGFLAAWRITSRQAAPR
jgi:hypothetical protein